MSKIRDEIIELLEPYMDKTEKICCLYKFKKDYQFTHAIHFNKGFIIKLLHKDVKYEHYFDVDGFRGPVGFNKHIFKDLDIVGHYDITNVLKYIQNKVNEIGEISDIQISEEIKFFISSGDCDTPNGRDFQEDFIVEIPNKPLHLYSEEEDEILLNILKKLSVCSSNIDNGVIV